MKSHIKNNMLILGIITLIYATAFRLIYKGITTAPFMDDDGRIIEEENKS